MDEKIAFQVAAGLGDRKIFYNIVKSLLKQEYESCGAQFNADKPDSRKASFGGDFIKSFHLLGSLW